MAQVISPEQAAALIPDNAIVCISSSSGLHCPDTILKALGERYAQTGRPRNLVTFHPIASGDMYGIAGMDHLAQPGLLKRVIAGRPYFEDALDWLEIHGGPEGQQLAAHWRSLDVGDVAPPASLALGEGWEEPPLPPRGRRRRRRRRRRPSGTAGAAS